MRRLELYTADKVFRLNDERHLWSARAGEALQIVNFRQEDGTLRVRPAAAEVATSGLPEGTVRGATSGRIGTAFREVVAIETAGAVRVYTIEGSTATEITAASGKWGNTRFPPGSEIRFAIIDPPRRDPTYIGTSLDPNPVLLITDGVTMLIRNGAETAPIRAVEPPPIGSVKQEHAMPVWAPIRDDGLTYTASGADFTASWQAAPDTDGLCVRFRATETASADDWAQIAWVGANTFLSGNQLVVQAHGDIKTFLDSCAVELRAPSATTRIHDPSDPDLPAAPPLQIELENGFHLIAFDLAIDEEQAQATYDSLRLVWTTDSPAADTDLYVAGVLGGGRIAGGAQAAAACRCSGSMAESPGVLARDMGGRSTGLMGVFDPRNAARLPVTSLLDYSLRVTAPQPSAAATAQGVDSLDLYLDTRPETGFPAPFSSSSSLENSPAAEPASPTYRASHTTATYSAGWSATGGRSPGEPITIVINDPIGPGARAGIGNRDLPSPHCIPAPPARMLMPAAGRLFTAAPLLDGAIQHGSVACSEYAEPIRFASVSDFGRSGGAAWCETASDTVLALSPMDEQAESRAPTPLLMLTDRAAYALDPTDQGAFALPRRVYGMGCLTAGSVASTRFGPVWLGTDRRMHTVSGPLPAGIGAALAQIPSAHLPRVAAIAKGRYLRLTLPASDGACPTLALFDLLEARWTTDEYEGEDIARLSLDSAGNLRAWTRSGTRLRLDHPTASADPGGEIVARATFGFPPSLTVGFSGSAGSLGLSGFSGSSGSMGSGSLGSAGSVGSGAGGSLLPDTMIYIGRIGAICDSEATATVQIKESETSPADPVVLDADLQPYRAAWTPASDRVALRHRVSLGLTATPGSRLLALFAELSTRPLKPIRAG